VAVLVLVLVLVVLVVLVFRSSSPGVCLAHTASALVEDMPGWPACMAPCCYMAW
jgi:hypothetical protein